MIKCTHKCARICQKNTRSRARSRIGFFVVPDRSHVLYCRSCQDNRRACGGRMHIFTDKTFAEAHSRVRICDCYFAFVFALFKNMVQQFAFLAIKTSILYIVLINVTALTVLFGIYFATYCGCIFSKVTRSTRTFTPPRKWSEVQYLSRHDDIVASGSYLRISPVILQ